MSSQEEEEVTPILEEDTCEDESEESTAPPINIEHMCSSCEDKFKQPLVLDCLHVFCTPCVEKLTIDPETDQPLTAIKCSICQQETQLSGKGIDGLMQDHVLNNMLDMSAIENMEIVCTCCKAREKAVARCSDCANFLCPNCVTAHQFMRCFENHKVVSFDEIKKDGSVSIHKPLFCPEHSSESMKYFCHTCKVPICNECMVTSHKQPAHNYERLQDTEEKLVEELHQLITESKDKIKICEEASTSLEGMLTELQLQRDNAKGLIQETFQSYKAFLEKCQDDLLNQLEDQHKEQELNVMETFHNVEKMIEKIEDGCKFTERILSHGNNIEILSMKKLISSQLMSLINNTPKPDVSINIEFVSDADKFQQAVKELFGYMKKEEPKQEVPATSLQSSFENEGFTLPPGVLSPDNPGIPPVSTHDYMPQLSLSGSVNMPNSMVTSIASSMPPPTERSLSRNSQSPAMSDSGISVDTGSSGSGSNTPMINLAALAKLGNVSVNSQGQITLNGQVIPGLNVNNVSGLPQNLTPNLTPRSVAGDINGIHDNMLDSPRSTASSVGGKSDTHSFERAIQNRGFPDPLSGLPTGMPGAMPGGILGRGAGLSSGTEFGEFNASDLKGSQDKGFGNDAMPGLRGANPLGSLHGNDPLGLQGGLLGSSGSSSRSTTPGIDNIAGLLNAPGLSQTSPPMNGMANIGHFSVPTSLNTFGHPGVPIGGSGAMGGGGNQFNPNQSNPPFPVRASGKMSAMQIRCKFGQLGPGKGQFNSPHGFCLGMDEDITVADTNNHRVQVFEKTGEFKYQFGIPGREEGQLWYPRKVAVMRSSGKYVVCDRGNERSRMQLFTKNGHFIKKIAIRYIDIVAGLAITQQGHIVAVDSVSPTVFCIAESGDLLKWFDCSDYMREPSDIAISGKEYFVCDFKGHCVVVFNEDGQFMRRIGCENITNFPNGIDISDAGDVLVGDSHGNRFHVAVFQRDGSLIGEFECPYVKVSRCCGLKITSEGYVVTLAKNNHHVLVLNTLYIT